MIALNNLLSVGETSSDEWCHQCSAAGVWEGRLGLGQSRDRVGILAAIYCMGRGGDGRTEAASLEDHVSDGVSSHHGRPETERRSHESVHNPPDVINQWPCCGQGGSKLLRKLWQGSWLVARRGVATRCLNSRFGTRVDEDVTVRHLLIFM